MAVSEDGRFCVANYFPAGNMMGAFKENVLPRGSPYVPKKEGEAGRKEVGIASLFHGSFDRFEASQHAGFR